MQVKNCSTCNLWQVDQPNIIQANKSTKLNSIVKTIVNYFKKHPLIYYVSNENFIPSIKHTTSLDVFSQKILAHANFLHGRVPEFSPDEIIKLCQFVEQKRNAYRVLCRRNHTVSKFVFKSSSGLSYTLEFRKSGRVEILLRSNKQRHSILGSGGFKKVSISIDYDTGHRIADATKVIQSPCEKRRLIEEFNTQKRFSGEKEFINLESLTFYKDKFGREKAQIRQQLCHGSLRSKVSKSLPILYAAGPGCFSKSRSLLNSRDTNNVILDLLNALNKLKKKNIVHADLKPSNFMYRQCQDGQLQVLVGDFGGANPPGELGKSKVVKEYTRDYAAPELMEGIRNGTHPYISSQADVWSLGWSLAEILGMGKAPWKGAKTEKEYWDQMEAYVQQYNPSHSPFLPKTLEHLVWRMTNPNPDDRISPENARNYFADIIGRYEFANMMAVRGYTLATNCCC